MNLQTFPAFTELDDEIKQEFYEDVQSSIRDINACVSELEAGASKEIIDQMYRALHTVKGNCNMVFLEPFVDAAHCLEDLFSDIRSEKIKYDDKFGRFAVVVVNAINQRIDNLMAASEVDVSPLESLKSIIQMVKDESEQQLALVQKAIVAVEDGHFNLDLVAVDSENGEGFSFLEATDIEFFQYMVERGGASRQQEKLFIQVAVPLAKSLNEKLKRNVEAQQLEAALLMFVLSFAWRGSPCGGNEEISVEQIFFVAGILNRMSGWQVAADLSLEVAERFDGKGIPNATLGDEIHPAAQVLALSIEFAQLVVANYSLGYKSCLFSAIKTINAKKDSKYKSRLIERFNQLLKKDYLNQPQW